MSRKTIGTGFLLWLVLFGPGISLLAQPIENLKIVQAESAFTIDGELTDWAGIAEIPVRLTPDGEILYPSSNLTVTARFSFDAGHFYVAVSVLDDRVEFPGRERREGDGFYLTFVDPETERSGGRPLIFGFSRFGDQPLAVIPRGENENAAVGEDIRLRITGDGNKQELTYELAIPWKNFPGFRPFLETKTAVNLSYDDLDAGQKQVVQLVPDPDYEPDKPAPKKAVPTEFVVGPARSPEFQVLLNANRFYAEDERKLNLAVHSPSPEQGWQIKLIATTPSGNVPAEKSLFFEEGLSVHVIPVEIGPLTTGVVDLSLGLIDDQGKLRYTDNQRFFILDRKQFEEYEARLSELKKGDQAGRDTVFRESLPTLEIRLQWIREFMEKSPPFADLERVQQWNGDIKDLFRKVDDGRPALFLPGRVARLGYRTEADESLRSYSVYIPDWTEAKTPLPLLVTLSTGEGGPRAGLSAILSNYLGPRARKRAGDFFVLAPEVEDPSGWYIGADGHRVLETIAHFKKIYAVDPENIILDGFSKGGYGALRLALQNPGVFKGVIIRSARIFPPENSGAENIKNMLARARGLNILVIHGDQDKEAPVLEIRAIVDEIQEQQADVRYIEVRGAGPDNSERWSDVFNWIKDVLGDSVVELKPPKKDKEKDKESEKKK